MSASAETRLRRTNDAVTEAAANLPALLLSVRTLSAQGFTERALDRLIEIRSLGLPSEDVITEIRAQLLVAAVALETYSSSGEFGKAVAICDRLVQLCPGITMFQEARSAAVKMLERHNTERAIRLRHDYQALNEMAAAARERNDPQGELVYRLGIQRHPLNGLQTSVCRLQNIATALSIVLDASIDHFDNPRLDVAKELLDAIAAIRASPQADTGLDGPAGWWQTAMLQLLGTIDLDAIFRRQTVPGRPLPTSFVSSDGTPMDTAVLAERSRELGARVVFSTSASSEYLARYGKAYVSSIFGACDCPFIIVLLVCTPKDRLSRLAADLGIDDRRLVLCSDDFGPDSHQVKILVPNERDPRTIPGSYYASSALLRTDVLLRHLSLPVFVSGIDTVLQRGVADLIELFRHHDIVLNRPKTFSLLGGQIVNNLVLTYPTENGFLFVQFLKNYLGDHLAQPIQGFSQDQLDLHMAKHHLIATGNSPAIGYFGDLDINNVMFNHSNYKYYPEWRLSFRFLNMFVGAFGENERLMVEDIATETPGDPVAAVA